MFIDNPIGKSKNSSLQMKCDICDKIYRGFLKNALKQEALLNHHECRICSNKRGGRKTAEKMSAFYSKWYSGDGNWSKRPEIREKISLALKGKKFSEERKAKLRKPKKVTEKVLEAARNPDLREKKRQRMLNDNPSKRPEVREKISKTISERYKNGEFSRSLDVGWYYTDKMLSPIWCRSGFEKKFLELISNCDHILYVESAERTPIDYIFNGSRRKYHPDFKITLTNFDIWIVEIKNYWLASLPQSLKKNEALLEWCDNNNFNGITLKTEEEIRQWLEKLDV